jgi:hypothetical protein
VTQSPSVKETDSDNSLKNRAHALAAALDAVFDFPR